MPSTDQFDKPDAGSSADSELTEDVKHLLDQLAAQITDADQRHTDSVHDMQVRIANLSDRATAAKPALPEDSAKALGRVEDAMAALASRLANVEPAPRRHDPDIDEASLALPDEVRAEVRRAMYDKPQDIGEAPPALRSAIAGATKSARSIDDEPASRLFAEEGMDHNPPQGAAPSPRDKGWDNPSAPPPRRTYRSAPATPPPAAATGAAPTTDRAWLEERFADIAGRVEQSLARLDPHNSLLSIGARFDQLERRFDSALGQLASTAPGDPGPLRAIEKQVTDIFAELDRAQKQLGRLDKIESRLAELRQSPSEEQMSRLIGAMAPNDKQLAAVAEAAAERVAERFCASTSPTAPPATDDPRLGELTTLMREFIDERRQGEAHNVEALDTMQLAMQHLIDRVEAIEAAQATGHEELMRATQAAPARRPDRTRDPLDFGVRESNLTPAAVSSGSAELPRLAVAGPQLALPDDDAAPGATKNLRDEPRYDHAPATAQQQPASATLGDLGDLGGIDDRPAITASSTDADINRQAMIAMARRAADRATRATPPPAMSADDAGGGGPFGWVRRFTSAGAANDQARAARRPRVLLVASFAAFLLAGFWMIAGTGLRGMVPGIGSERPAAPAKPQGTSERKPAADQAPARASTRSPDDESAAADHRKAEREAAREPAPVRYASGPTHQPDARPQPAIVRVSDGIVVDNALAVVPPAVRQQIQTASLTPQSEPERPASVASVPAAPSAIDRGAARSVELPPALIGPLSLRQAAANGDPLAQLEIGIRFAEGKGVPKDFAQAVNWYQRAATHGLATAQYRLGNLYERGLGVPADPARARVWYGRAAAQGNVRAMHNLAVLNANQPEDRRDDPAAVQLFSEAAARGLADSQYNLGTMYERGRGVPASLSDAYKWYALAARAGDKDAIRRRDAVRSRLDSASVNAADKLVIEWRPKPVEATANDPRNAGPVWPAQPPRQ